MVYKKASQYLVVQAHKSKQECQQYHSGGRGRRLTSGARSLRAMMVEACSEDYWGRGDTQTFSRARKARGLCSRRVVKSIKEGGVVKEEWKACAWGSGVYVRT